MEPLKRQVSEASPLWVRVPLEALLRLTFSCTDYTSGIAFPKQSVGTLSGIDNLYELERIAHDFERHQTRD